MKDKPVSSFDPAIETMPRENLQALQLAKLFGDRVRAFTNSLGD
jgi:hypothetical protein